MSADLSYALRDLADWSVRHGIHQARAVLAFASEQASTAVDNEQLGAKLLECAGHVEVNGDLLSVTASDQPEPPVDQQRNPEVSAQIKLT
jgi:hypothetical protein